MTFFGQRDTEIKLSGTLTLGGVLMMLSVALALFAMFFMNLAMPIMVAMRASGVILTIGYVVCVWQDWRRQIGFRFGLLGLFLVIAFVIAVLTPIMMAASSASVKSGLTR